MRNTNTNNTAPRQKVKLPMGWGRNEGLPAQPSASAGSQIRLRDKEAYGLVMNMKGTFAFVQAIFSDEQLFCGEREFYHNIKNGDRVAYIPHDGHKGPYVESLRFLIPALEGVVQKVSGVVSRVPDRHRSQLGVIELDTSKLSPDHAATFSTKYGSKILYRASDVINASLPRAHFLDVGDAVEMNVTRQHDSGMFFANEIKFTQLKRDRELAAQVTRMLEAGAVRELGVVTTVRGNEFGFIQAQDRKDEIYFKVDDVSGTSERIKEGTELEFFVITEIVKGKVSDRAIHLKVAPTGTVQLEVVIGTANAAVVTVAPGSDDDGPGIALLAQPITHGDKTISQIDLWARCLPDELVCRVGDQLTLNTHYYRPEKLFFGREVKLVQYCPIGRDTGTVCGLKEAFGFVASDSRKLDLYFKSSMVLDSNGQLFPANQLKMGMALTFDVSVEDGKMLRAVRVQVSQPPVAALEERWVVRKDVMGVVVRSAIKKDSYGLIKLSPADWMDAHATDFLDPVVADYVSSFDTNRHMRVLELLALPNSVKRVYLSCLAKFNNLTSEESTVSTAGTTSASVNVLKISKVDPGVSSAPHEIKNADGDGDRQAKLVTMMGKEGCSMQFAKEDYVSTDLGQLTNDLEVIFDVVYDRYRGRLQARRVRMTDEPVSDASGEQYGVVELVLDKGDRFGYVRAIPSDEKLLWQGADVTHGRAVSFEVRRRGGLRCAANLKLLEGNTLEAMKNTCSALLADGVVTGLVLDNNTAVIVDTSANAALKNRYVPLEVLMDALQAVAEVGKSKQWEKASFRADEAGGTSSPLPAESSSPKPPQATQDGDRVAYKAKHFSPAVRTAVPLKSDGEELLVKAGDIITCSPAVMWTQQVAVTHISPKEVIGAAIKKQGSITRHKVKMTTLKDTAGVDTEAWSRFHIPTMEMTEISLAEGTNVVYYLLPSSEVCLSSENSRDLIQTGDMVDFWALPGSSYAFGAILVPKAQLKDSTNIFNNTRRPGFNAELKEQKTKTGSVNLITMAKGPPNDLAGGFEAGWRAVNKEELAVLPWAQLLSHLTN